MLAIHHAPRVTRLVLACTSPGGRLARERSMDVRRAAPDGELEAPWEQSNDRMDGPSGA